MPSLNTKQETRWLMKLIYFHKLPLSIFRTKHGKIFQRSLVPYL
jgi:hypothetical protein